MDALMSLLATLTFKQDQREAEVLKRIKSCILSGQLVKPLFPSDISLLKRAKDYCMPNVVEWLTEYSSEVVTSTEKKIDKSEILDLVQSADFDINTKDIFGETLLVRVLKSDLGACKDNLVLTLLKSGADYSATDYYGHNNTHKLWTVGSQTYTYICNFWSNNQDEKHKQASFNALLSLCYTRRERYDSEDDTSDIKQLIADSAIDINYTEGNELFSYFCIANNCPSLLKMYIDLGGSLQLKPSAEVPDILTFTRNHYERRLDFFPKSLNNMTLEMLKMLESALS